MRVTVPILAARVSRNLNRHLSSKGKGECDGEEHGIPHLGEICYSAPGLAGASAVLRDG